MMTTIQVFLFGLVAVSACILFLLGVMWLGFRMSEKKLKKFRKEDEDDK